MNSSLYNLIRSHYRELQGYVSAGMEAGKDESKIFLNANENPYELPGMEGFNRYTEPQPPALAAAFADAYGVNADQIVMTRGADEAIVILTKLFCEPHEDAVLICPPTFGMYGVDAKAMPANVLEVALQKKDGTYALNKDGIIKTAADPKNKIKLVYICSPNNPTGTSFSHAVIKEICEALEDDAIIILDETYAEFSEQGSLTKALADHPNLIILRTLSKSYAFAGMRMGCFISGDTDFIALAKSKALDAYPIPRATLDAALHVLSPEIRKIAMENIATLLNEREQLEAGLKKSPLVKHVYPSDANFLLVEMERAAEFIKFAAENNVVLRDFSSKPLTENCIRISIGMPEHNDLVLKLLGDFAS